MEIPTFLTDAPFHFHWNLCSDGILKDFQTLDLQILEHIKFKPDVMPIQALLFHAFIYISKYKHLKPDPASAQKTLREANSKIDGLADEEEKTGYRIVAKSLEACILYRVNPSDTSLKADIEDLLSKKTVRSQAYIDSVRAFALNRLGLTKYEEAQQYYQSATKICPENTEWLFQLAKVYGRIARTFAQSYEFTKEMEEHVRLLENVLRLDNEHELARVELALCLVRTDKKRALQEIQHAIKCQPDNPYILTGAIKVLRATDKYDEAIQVFEKAIKTGISNTHIYHQIGLVYRDKYIAAKSKRNRRRPPPKNLLHEAIGYFTKAIEGNNINSWVRLDRAKSYQSLRMIVEAEDDFQSILATEHLEARPKFTTNFKYAEFLTHTKKDSAKASLHFKNAVDCAVTHCLERPVSRESPKPKFRGIGKDIEIAIAKYRNINEEGLKGLAWLHQALGEHDAAKQKYEQYLDCDGKSTDHDAIYHLIKSLIQLDDLEGARRNTEILQTLEPTLATEMKAECALRQGEIEQATLNGAETAREFYREAIEAHSLPACYKLAEILKQERSVASWEFRRDCATILHCCEAKNQQDSQLYKDVTSMMKLDDATCGTLRKLHLDMENLILNNSSRGDNKEILTAATLVLNEARSLLDRMMSKFQEAHYPHLEHSRCMFFHISQENSTVPRTQQDVRDDVDRKLKKYKWLDFDTRFPDLLDFLVQIQPAHPDNHDNWYLALSQLNNVNKHVGSIEHSKYHIPVIMNGKAAKGVNPIPDGPAVSMATKVPGVDYELFVVTELARKATTKAEVIVAEFMNNI